jgi:hypothetical protein
MSLLIEARVAGIRPAGVDLLLEGREGLEYRDDGIWVSVLVRESFDYRGCTGLPVFIHADYERGLPILDRVIEHNPSFAALCADTLLRYENGRLTEWA